MSQNRSAIRGAPRKVSSLSAPSSSAGTRADASNVQKRFELPIKDLVPWLYIIFVLQRRIFAGCKKN
jgi:hypothetical protein